MNTLFLARRMLLVVAAAIALSGDAPAAVKDGRYLYVVCPGIRNYLEFGGAGILEIVVSHAGDAYRAVYAVRLAGRIYALHVFQKKSRSGIKTPKSEIELIKARLKRAEEEHARWLKDQKGAGGR